MAATYERYMNPAPDRFTHRGKELLVALIRRDDFVQIDAITMGNIYVRLKGAVLSIGTDGKLSLRLGKFMGMEISKVAPRTPFEIEPLEPEHLESELTENNDG